MAQLFSSIEEFKIFVGGAVDNNEAMLESLSPDITAAIDSHIRNWLGDELTEELLDAYPDATGPLSTLTEKVQAAVAPLALSYAPDTKGVSFSENGFTRPENGTFQYQDNNYKAAFLTRGYEAIELMLKYLDANSADFTTWSEKDRHRSLILNYASDFRRVSSQKISRYTFESLLPLIGEAEYFAVEKLLPTQFFARLKYASDLDASEKTVVLHLKAIIANFTIAEATRRNRVKIVGTDLVQISGKEGDKAAKDSDLERTATWTNLAADRHVMKLKDYLTRHRAEFPLCFHESVGGTNTNTDAWGYMPPPATPEEIDNLEQLIIKAHSRRVVSL